MGNALASAYSEIKTEIPETVDEAFSRLILEDPLKRDYDVVSDAAVAVQQSLNDEAGLGLKAQPPRLNRSRVEGLIKKFAGYEKSKDGLWLLGAPIVTFSQSVADDTLKKNADFQYKAGLRPRIIRDDAYGCCEWCSRIAGTYNYPNVPKDVFKRHENCRCTVDYDPAAGKRIQDVWTKRSTIREDSGKIEKRKQLDGIISSPIERGSKGDPSAISHFNVDLNNRQRRLLERLPDYGSRVTVPKDSVSMTDLSALTANTGDEFAMFTKGKDRLIIRGGNTNTPVTVEDAEKMAAEGYRWSGHTHPGTGDNVKAASKGDYAILEAFGQKESVIYDSLGRYKTFRGLNYDGQEQN